MTTITVVFKNGRRETLVGVTYGEILGFCNTNAPQIRHAIFPKYGNHDDSGYMEHADQANYDLCRYYRWTDVENRNEEWVIAPSLELQLENLSLR